MHIRADGRRPDELRPLQILLAPIEYPEGSALIEMGRTRVLCTATVEEGVPGWLRGKGQGWITAEYSMLPRATNTRTRRERGTLSGRTQEIQRLIGRALRTAADLTALGERTITIDCDVLQADGGTRTAAITGGYVALALACGWLVEQGLLDRSPLTRQVAAISVGVVGGVPVLDLPYAEDSAAEVDFNVVMTDTGEFVELQGTGESATFSRSTLDELIALAGEGIATLLAAQRTILQQQPGFGQE